jgi:hypothetical protein
LVELPHRPREPRLTLLSSTPASLETHFEVWDKELAVLDRSEPPPPPEAISRERGTLNLAALAAKVTAVDHDPAHGSRIPLLLEHAGPSVLLGADAHPTVLIPSMKALAANRGAALTLKMDVFKLSHRGGQANATTNLMRTVQDQHDIVSTSSAIFGHPNDAAIARVNVSGGAHRASGSTTAASTRPSGKPPHCSSLTDTSLICRSRIRRPSWYRRRPMPDGRSRGAFFGSLRRDPTGRFGATSSGPRVSLKGRLEPAGIRESGHSVHPCGLRQLPGAAVNW